jgi:hypothetical protein
MDMASGLEMGSEELRSRLVEFDQAVGLLFPGYRYELLIVGGGALILMGLLDRPTADLDALTFPADLQDLMEQYDIRGHAVTFEHNFPLNRDDRRVALDLPTENGICYTASLEDLVASKLCSHREQDQSDIRESAVLDAIDWEKLEAVAAEMPLNCLSADHAPADIQGIPEHLRRVPVRRGHAGSRPLGRAGAQASTPLSAARAVGRRDRSRRSSRGAARG